MNRCSAIREMLLKTDFESTDARITRHLAECPDCLQLWEITQRADDALKIEFSGDRETIPVGFHQRFMSSLRHEGTHFSPASRFRRRVGIAGAWAGATAVAALLAFAMIQPFRTPHRVVAVNLPPVVTRVSSPGELPNLAVPDLLKREQIIAASGTKDVFTVASSFAGNTASALHAILHEPQSKASQ